MVFGGVFGDLKGRTDVLYYFIYFYLRLSLYQEAKCRARQHNLLCVSFSVEVGSQQQGDGF